MKNFTRSAALLLLFAISAFSADWKSLKPQGYVSDFAGVIDAPSRNALEQYSFQVEQATGVQMAFVTVKSLEGDPIEDAANDIFRSFGVGKKGKDDGVMLLLAVGDRRSRLEVGPGLGPVLTDGLSGSVLRAMRPSLQAANYGEAILYAAQNIGSAVAKEKGVSIESSPLPRRRVQRKESIPWPFLIGILVVFLLLLRGGSRGGGGGMGGFLTGMLIGTLTGGRGGGGFGGYDSGGGGGGGFGGFGGGDSGGGGASGSW